MKIMLVLLWMISTQALAQSEAVRQCLKRSSLVPIQVLARSAMPQNELNMALFTLCDEMDDPSYPDTPARFAQYDPWYDRAVSVVGTIISGVYKEGIASLAETLEGSPAQQRYRAHLEMIKRIKDPYQRIQRTFHLARSSQGSYGNILNLLRNPGQVIEAGANGEVGGLCREFAVLLAFSLRWVARPYGDVIPPFGGLSPDAFNVTVEYSMQHAWVRVHMPKYEGGRMTGFNRFDLDSTWHESYIPLNPRRTGEKRQEIETKFKQCQRVVECVNRAAAER